MVKKNVLFVFLAFSFLLFACTPQNQNVANVDANNSGVMQVTVSILPQKWFVDQIGGELVKTQTLVGTGDDPHSYEPSPSQMVALGESRIYFTIGVEFEDAWMDRLVSANKTMRVVDSAEDAPRIEMVGGHHHHAEADHGLDHAHEGEHTHEEHDEYDDHNDPVGLDPHVWFSAKNAEIIAKNIAQALIEADPEHKSDYQNNLEATLKEIKATDSKVQELLKGVSRDRFMIVHPAWGYFAHDYGLHMIPVEIHGSEPGPEDLAFILERAKAYRVSVLFVEKGTNMNLARSVAKQAGIEKIVEWDPMAYSWSENMVSLAQDLQEALK